MNQVSLFLRVVLMASIALPGAHSFAQEPPNIIEEWCRHEPAKSKVMCNYTPMESRSVRSEFTCPNGRVVVEYEYSKGNMSGLTIYNNTIKIDDSSISALVEEISRRGEILTVPQVLCELYEDVNINQLQFFLSDDGGLAGTHFYQVRLDHERIIFD